jgi:hypothetical protein
MGTVFRNTEHATSLREIKSKKIKNKEDRMIFYHTWKLEIYQKQEI